MKKGDIVTIYQDPWTKQRVEGRAILFKPIDWDKNREFEYWEVKFLGRDDGDPAVARFIKKERRIKL